MELTSGDEHLLRNLLSKKDFQLEGFLKHIIETELQNNGNTTLEPEGGSAGGSSSGGGGGGGGKVDLTFDERENMCVEQLGNRISGLSGILWHRVQPIVQSLLSKKLKSCLDSQLANVVQIKRSNSVMIENYKKLFLDFTNSPKISFQTGNVFALKNISPRDYWVFQYFSIATCRRIRSDNLVQIGISGRSSLGKSCIFEAPLTEIIHTHVTSNFGVGRFSVGSKNILFFHDCDILDTFFSRDRDTIKALARSEPTQSKIHSSIQSIPPIHLFYSSNDSLFDHKIPVNIPKPKQLSQSLRGSEEQQTCSKRPWNSSQEPRTTISGKGEEKKLKKMAPAASSKAVTKVSQLQIPALFRFVETQVSQQHQQQSNSRLTGGGQQQPAQQHHQKEPFQYTKHASQVQVTSKNAEQISAVRARFMELYVPCRLDLDASLFPASGSFQREHLICGIYLHIMDLMENSYSRQDFRSQCMCLYVLSGIAKNIGMYQSQVASTSDDDFLLDYRIRCLIEKYFPLEEFENEHNSILALLQENLKKEEKPVPPVTEIKKEEQLEEEF